MDENLTCNAFEVWIAWLGIGNDENEPPTLRFPAVIVPQVPQIPLPDKVIHHVAPRCVT